MSVALATKNMTREEWLEARRRGIGGSDAAAIAGLNPWKSPVEVYLEKIGAVEPPQAGEAAHWGNILEPEVAKEFKRRTGYHVQRDNFMRVHPEHEFMIANVDRLVRVPGRGWGVLEIKTTGASHKDDWADGKVPDHYLIQMQHYLAVTGLKFGFFAVLIGGQKYHQVEVERDDELIGHLIELEKDFWKHVETRTPPPLDWTESSARALEHLYPAESSKDVEVQLPDSVEYWVQEYLMASAAAKEAKQRKQRAANELKAALGEAQIGRVGEHKVIWKPVRSERFDTTAFKQAHPELYRQFLKESITRRLTVS